MTDRENNEDIRRRFRQTRQHYDSVAPAFQEILNRPHPSYRFGAQLRNVPVAAVSLALVAAILGVSYLGWREQPDSRQALETDFVSMSSWRSPTDFLLEIPGDDLLKTTPSIPSTLPDFTKLQKLENLSGNAR